MLKNRLKGKVDDRFTYNHKPSINNNKKLGKNILISKLDDTIKNFTNIVWTQ